jgi:putative membrane protein
MKRTGFAGIACALVVTIACTGDSRSAGYDDSRSPESSREDDADRTVGTSGQADQAHGATADARHFAEKAAYAGNAEVKLGQLALERAQSPQVKEFAQMMVRDHSRAGSDLKQAVSRHDVATPTGLDAEHQQLFDRLSKLRGSEFDREYMKAMVDGHMKVKSMLQSRAAGEPGSTVRATGTSGTATTQLDMAVNQWASKSLPTVQQHLQKAEQIRDGEADHAGAKH